MCAITTQSLRTHHPLAPLTTFGVGGPAEWFVDADSLKVVVEVCAFVDEHQLPLTVLGGGSNVLVADEGVRGVVMKMSIPGITVTRTSAGVFVQAGAGVVFDELVAYTVREGWWGLENLSSIPGTVGAAPVQNIGAYGVEVAHSIYEVSAYDLQEKHLVTLPQSACAFAYRDSCFKQQSGRYIITGVTFVLSEVASPHIAYADLATYFQETPLPTQSAIRNAVIDIRSKKFPDWHVLGTAGSFFKNPIISRDHGETLRAQYAGLPLYDVNETQVKVSLAWILDRVLQVRGVRIGNVGTYEGQALVMVAYEGATAREIDAFARMIEEKVFAETHITLEREVRAVQ